MSEETGESTQIDLERTGSWPAEKAVVGTVNLRNPRLTVRSEGGKEVVELAGECAPNDLTMGRQYPCSVEANRSTWSFTGAIDGLPTAGHFRGRDFFHHVLVRSQGEVRASRRRGA